MSSKLLNIILAIFILCSIGLTNSANAGLLIIGDTITDSSGQTWEYLGSYELAGSNVLAESGIDTLAPNLFTAEAINGLQAAEYFFGTLGYGQEYATSTKEATDAIDTINNLAWYDLYNAVNSDGVSTGVSEFAENAVTEVDYTTPNGPIVGPDGLYNNPGDLSAWVKDRLPRDDGTATQVYRSVVDVPEPATLAIFSLALFGLGARRLKNQ
ncbi:MAG: PEP-CTERM sorting domain-containing protein [Colwellia sp.]|nr:PEP-CTERM sorting domain-containing protein [Colwellia sp.]